MGSLVRKLTIAMCLMAATLYVAAPFWTAWEIREAVKSDDVATLKDELSPNLGDGLRVQAAV
jgi:hypothetical protein